MADNTTILTIKADASGAKRDLEEIERKARAVKAAARSQGGGGDAQSLPTAWEIRKGSGASEFSRELAKDIKQQQRDALREQGRGAGQEIGKFFVNYIVARGASTAFSLMRDPLKANAGLNKIDSATSAAVMGGTAGAALGSLIGGPVGTAIGAGVGTAAGGLVGWLNQAKTQRNQSTMAAYQQTLMMRNYQLGESVAASDEAFAYANQAGTIGAKLARLGERRKQLVSGEGNMSVNALRERMAGMQRSRETETPEYRELQGNLAMQLGRVAQLSAQERALKRTPLAGLWQGSDFADALSARGINVGARPDVAGANEKLVDLMSQLVELQKKQADAANGTRNNAWSYESGTAVNVRDFGISN